MTQVIRRLGSFRKWNFQNVFTPYIDNTDENVAKSYFYILSFPERKKSGGSGISYIITIYYIITFQITVLKNKQDIDQNVFLLVFEMS